MNNEFLPLSVPDLSGNELKYVSECITTGWVSSVGSYVDKFEKLFADYIGTERAVAVVNGTAALHISLLLSGVKAGDEVIVPNLTFVATVNAVRYCGANPVFMDSTWDNLGLDIEKVKRFLEEETFYSGGNTHNKTSKARIAAIIPMHTFGYAVDMDALDEVLLGRNIPVIEDATESLGAKYRGRMTGSLSRMACFSFNGNKIVTTGGGGMITTNDEELAARAKHLTTTAKRSSEDFDHDEVGYNYRLVNVLAAIGVAQMERVEEFVQKKRANLALYDRLLSSSSKFYMHKEPAYCFSNYWMYSLVIRKGVDLSVRDVIGRLKYENVQARPVWKLMNSLPMFQNFQSYECEVCYEIRNSVINIPCSSNLLSADVERVAEVLNKM
jgi:perosamine synthetase